MLLVASATSAVAAAATEAQPKPAARRWSVGNETGRTLEIEAEGRALLIFAPLERRVVSDRDFRRFALSRWGDLISFHEVKEVERERGYDALLVVVGLGVWFSIAWAITAAFVGAPTWWKLGWGALGVALVIAWGADRMGRNEKAHAEPRERGFERARVVALQGTRWVGQQFYLCISLLIGVFLPGAAIFFAADGLGLYRDLRDVGTSNHAVVLTVIGRVMQLVFVASAALLPALLYFLFDREHLQTLRTRFVRHILRFDPTVMTQAAVKAKYEKLMEEAFGRGGRILPGRRSPILLGTLLIALGWTFTLLHGDVRVIDERGITSLFEPRSSAVTFAFLGAYFFGLNAVLRGYVRRDLRPKTYSTFAVRVIVVVVLAWVVELQWSGTTLFVLAFLFGIVPDTALVLLKESLRDLGRRFTAIEEEQDPLTSLEGIDLYDRARLFEEGVTNVESLAHHDIVDLMLQTRIPAPRIVDWVDQAILYLHAGPRAADGRGIDRAATLSTLRTYGIRTATDLVDVIDGARQDRDQILRILGPAQGVPRLRTMYTAITDDEWMANLRCWRRLEKPRRLRVAQLPKAA